MTTAVHAQRILDAWEISNVSRFRAELEDALSSCQTSLATSKIEAEQQELLQSIAEHLQRVLPEDSLQTSAGSLEVGFSLLRHLRARTSI